MLEKLKKKWKVSNLDLFLIFCVFGITGSTTAYISKVITKWVGVAGASTWSSDWWIGISLRIGMLIFGYQIIILIVSLPFGQFKFFWNYEKKILRKMGFLKKEENKTEN